MGTLIAFNPERIPNQRKHVSQIASLRVEIDQEMECFKPFKRMLDIELVILSEPLRTKPIVFPDWHMARATNASLALFLIDIFDKMYQASKTNNDYSTLAKFKNTLKEAKKKLISKDFFSNSLDRNAGLYFTFQGWMDVCSKLLLNEKTTSAQLAVILYKPLLEERLHQMKFLDGRLPKFISSLPKEE